MATDVSISLKNLALCMNRCYLHMKELNIKAPLVAHIGDGNFHFTIIVDPSDKEELERAKTFAKRVVQEALRLGGTCTGEHGIGLGKIEHLAEEHHDTLFIMQNIKRSMDPYNLFNPGKLFQAYVLSLAHQEASIFSNQTAAESHHCVSYWQPSKI